MLTFLLSQMGSLDHAYSEHQQGEVCDYCVSTPSLDHGLISSVQNNFSNTSALQQNKLIQVSFSASSPRFYAVRAPPRLI